MVRQKLVAAAVVFFSLNGCGTTVREIESNAASASGSTGNQGGSSGSGGQGGTGGTGGVGDQGGAGGTGACEVPPTVTVAYEGGPPNFSYGKFQVHCLDLRITNTSPNEVDICNWQVNLQILNRATNAGGLLDGTEQVVKANYQDITLARLDASGQVLNAMLGPGDLELSGSDQKQSPQLKGVYTLTPQETVKAAVIFNTANNQAMIGDKVRCSFPTFGLVGNILTVVQ